MLEEFSHLGKITRNVDKLSHLPTTGRMFDALIGQFGLLGPDVAGCLAETYALVTTVGSKANEFKARGVVEVSTGEMDVLAKSSQELIHAVEQAQKQLGRSPSTSYTNP